MTPALVVGVDEASRLLGADPTQVRRWIEQGLLPVVKYPSIRRPGEPSRRVLVAVDDLAAFVKRYREGALPPVIGSGSPGRS